MRAEASERPGSEASLEVGKAFSQNQLDILVAVLVDQVENALGFCDISDRSNFLEAFQQSLQSPAAAQDFEMKGCPLGKEVQGNISSVIRSQRYSPGPIQ